MAKAQMLFILFVIGLFACHSPEKKSGPLPLTDSSQISQTQQIHPDNSIYVLDTTMTLGFQGDTTAQIDQTLTFIKNFDKASVDFRKDTFSVDEKTTEGCEIIVVQDASTEFIKLYGTLFGEMGKREFKFYMLRGQQPKLCCAVFTDISYDKPMYQNDMQITETKTTFQVFSNNQLIAVLDDKKRKQNPTTEKLKSVEGDTKQFFKDYIGQIKMGK